jgi:hypothetical protein
MLEIISVIHEKSEVTLRFWNPATFLTIVEMHGNIKICSSEAQISLVSVVSAQFYPLWCSYDENYNGDLKEMQREHRTTYKNVVRS